MSARTEQRAMSSASDAVACMLCGSQQSVAHFGGSGEGLPMSPVSERYRITHSERRLVRALQRCSGCGMVTLPLHYAPPVDYQEAADPYYLEQASQRIANAHRLLGLIPAGGHLLDVGCAVGFLLVAARERGFTVQGVEMSAWASQYARDENQLDVKTGRLETANFPAASFDAVVMADVIEHLTDPPNTLQAIHRVLKPDGRLLLLTPDVGSIAARLAGPRWWGLLDDHYFYYSRQTLTRFLAREGFAVERISALGRVFPLAHWLYKLAPYSPRLHATADRAMRALRLDGLRISINLGDQMACVARKK
jgi:2-polyprenyl-3-methyl-5-hydroxy-6-metoxy-1,4-benzoquinol methylase